MSYLDQLRQESARRKAQEQEALQKREYQKQRLKTEVKPALEKLHLYLRELVQHLNYVKPTINMSYEIKGYGKLEGKQQDYVVLTYEERQARFKNYSRTEEEQERAFLVSHNFFLNCKVVFPHKIRIEKRHPVEMEKQQAFFVSHHLQFDCTEENDRYGHFIRAIFIMEAMIPISFEFIGNLETGLIDLNVTNFLGTERKTYTLRPQEITHQFLDEFSKYLTRQPHQLMLGERQRRNKTYTLSPQQRDQLEFEVWLQKTQRELGEVILEESPRQETSLKHLEEFDEWLRRQETEMVTPIAPPQNSKLDVLRFFKGMGKKLKKI